MAIFFIVVPCIFDNIKILFTNKCTLLLNTFHLGYKNQPVYDVSGTSRCLFWDKFKTHK